MDLSRPFPVKFYFFKAGIDQEYQAVILFACWIYVYLNQNSKLFGSFNFLQPSNQFYNGIYFSQVIDSMELMAGVLNCLKIQALENWFLSISGALTFTK
jgi:hypothetical protein